MNAERLSLTADFLDVLPVEKFNFGIVAEEFGKPMLLALAAGATKCGTTACAMGWLPAIFPALVKWTHRVWSTDYACDPSPIHPTNTVCLVDEPSVVGFSVAERVFEISRLDAYYLFNPGGAAEKTNELDDFATPKDEAAHIRAYLAEAA